MATETREQRAVRERFVDQYLPAWCASRPQPLNPSNFLAPDWSFLTPGLAHWFLNAIDEGVAEATSDGEFRLGSSYPDGIFEHAGRKDESPRPMRIRKESFFEVAAVGMLAVRYRWPVERLRFQPPGWALDFLAYVDDDWDRAEVAIAGEAKQLQTDAVALSASLKVCGERGDHNEADCTEPRNHHRKYRGLLEYSPRILWIVGPGAFADSDPDLVFRVEQSGGNVVRLRRTDASALTFSSP